MDIDFCHWRTTDTAVMSQGHHSEPQSPVCSIVHCSCVGQHLTVLTHAFELSSHPWLPLLHALRAATRVTLPSSLSWTKGHLASSLLWGLSAVAFLPCISLYSPVRHASLGLGLSHHLSGTGSLPFLLAHQHARHHFSAVFPTFVLHVAIHFGVGVCCYFHFFIGGGTLQQ